MQQVIIVLIVMVLLGVVGLCGSVLAVGMHLSAPRFAVIGKAPAALSDAESVAIQSDGGATLSGWWLPARRPGGGAVVLMHGVWENRLSLVKRATVLNENGFAVLLFDFQGHGGSGGRHITYGHLESLDAAAAGGFVRRRVPDERVGAIGVSLGGAAALLGAKPLDVDGLVIESVYADIDSALVNRLRVGLGRFAGPLFAPVLGPAFKVLLPPILGVTPNQLRPIDHVANVRAPLLVASGTADDRTPIAEAEAVFRKAPEPKRFWAVPDAAHVDLERHDPDEYWRTVLPFLVKRCSGLTPNQVRRADQSIPQKAMIGAADQPA